MGGLCNAREKYKILKKFDCKVSVWREYRGGGKMWAVANCRQKNLYKKIRCYRIGRTRLRDQGRILWQVRAFSVWFLWRMSSLNNSVRPCYLCSADNLWISYTVTDGSCNKLMKRPDIHILRTSAMHDVTLISLLTTWNEEEGIATRLGAKQGQVPRNIEKYCDCLHDWGYWDKETSEGR
jgi:hypothetical protein